MSASWASVVKQRKKQMLGGCHAHARGGFFHFVLKLDFGGSELFQATLNHLCTYCNSLHCQSAEGLACPGNTREGGVRWC